MIVVADASPINALLQLKQLDLHGRLYDPVYIPVTVATDIKTLPAFGYDFFTKKERSILMQATEQYCDKANK